MVALQSSRAIMTPKSAKSKRAMDMIAATSMAHERGFHIYPRKRRIGLTCFSGSLLSPYFSTRWATSAVVRPLSLHCRRKLSVSRPFKLTSAYSLTSHMLRMQYANWPLNSWQGWAFLASMTDNWVSDNGQNCTTKCRPVSCAQIDDWAWRVRVWCESHDDSRTLDKRLSKP